MCEKYVWKRVKRVKCVKMCVKRVENIHQFHPRWCKHRFLQPSNWYVDEEKIISPWFFHCFCPRLYFSIDAIIFEEDKWRFPYENLYFWTKSSIYQLIFTYFGLVKKKNQLNYDFEVNFLSKKMKQGLLDTFDQPLSENVNFHRFF